jgi:alpha-tubulin suppressor-like RCC1 family protein
MVTGLRSLVGILALAGAMLSPVRLSAQAISVDAVQLASGGSHSCAVRASGKVACWGQNLFGQLGNGPSASLLDEPQAVPVSVQKVDDAAEVVAGDGYACARRKAGAVACWGRNGCG